MSFVHIHRVQGEIVQDRHQGPLGLGHVIPQRRSTAGEHPVGYHIIITPRVTVETLLTECAL